MKFVLFLSASLRLCESLGLMLCSVGWADRPALTEENSDELNISHGGTEARRVVPEQGSIKG